MKSAPPDKTNSAVPATAARGASVKAAILADPEAGARRLVAEEGPALGAVDASQPFKEEKARLVDAFERRYLAALLERNGGNVSRSAREAGIERAYLQRLVKKFGLRADARDPAT